MAVSLRSSSHHVQGSDGAGLAGGAAASSPDGALAPGQSTSFGFVVVGVTRPANCTINGGPCNTLPALSLRLAPPSRDPAGANRVDGSVPALAIAPRSALARRRGRLQRTRRVPLRWRAAQR